MHYSLYIYLWFVYFEWRMSWHITVSMLYVVKICQLHIKFVHCAMLDQRVLIRNWAWNGFLSLDFILPFLIVELYLIFQHMNEQLDEPLPPGTQSLPSVTFNPPYTQTTQFTLLQPRRLGANELTALQPHEISEFWCAILDQDVNAAA